MAACGLPGFEHLNGGKWTLAAEYTEVESGTRTNNRPELAAALAACKRLKAKLIVAKLDRLSRNVAFITTLMGSGVEFVAADMPHANKMTLQVLAGVRRARTRPQQRPHQAGAHRGQGTRGQARRAEAGGDSLRGVARVLNARGVPSASGVSWSPVAVSNIIKRSMEDRQ